MGNIKDIIDKLVKDSDRIIANPETIKNLRKQGLPIHDVPAQTIEELFAQRKEFAIKIVDQLPVMPTDLQPAIRSLYQETRECIFFGLNGAAITLSGILAEFVLKHATFIKEVGGYQKYDPSKWDQIEKMELARAIDRAKKAKLLDSKMAKRLHAFRESIRNPYNHYNIKKITENVIAKKVKELNTETGEYVEKDIYARDNPVIQSTVKPFVDKHKVLYVFHFVDEVVKYLLLKIAPNKAV